MKQKVLLIAIILIGLIFRTWHARDWFHFEMDEEVIAWKTLKFWRDGQPFLIGGGTPFGFHLGPAFYYVSSIPLIFTRGDPIGWMFFIVFVSISTLYLIWLVGKTLYNETVGLVAVALWAFSFTTVMFNRHWWPLVLGPLFSLVTLLSLFHIMNGRSRWWIVLGLTLSLAWQADLTNLMLFLAAGVITVKTFKTQWKNIVAAAGILVLSFIPLVVFEIRHPGANLGGLNITRSDPALAGSDLSNSMLDLVRFIPSTYASLLIPGLRSVDLSDWFTWCKDVAASRISTSPIQMFIAVGLLFYPIIRWVRKRQHADFVMMIILVSGIGGISVFRLFGGDLFDFYLAPLFPVFLIVTAVLIISVVKRKYLILSTIAILLLINVPSLWSVQHRQGLAIKQQAVAWVAEQVGDRPFALDSISRCHRYNGIRYLFLLAGKEPVMSFIDPDLSWLYDAPPATTYPETFVAFTTPDDLSLDQEKRYNALIKRSIARKRFGAFDVVISDNHDQRYHIDFSSP